MRSFCSPSGPQTATPPTERPGFVWSGPPLLLLLLARMLLSSFLCKKTDYDVVVHPVTVPPKHTHTHTHSRILHWLPWVLRVLESNPGTKWGWNDCWSNDDVLIYPPKLRRTSDQWAVSSEQWAPTYTGVVSKGVTTADISDMFSHGGFIQSRPAAVEHSDMSSRGPEGRWNTKSCVRDFIKMFGFFWC